MMIKVDDDIVQQFTNESTFLIEIKKIRLHSASEDQHESSPQELAAYDVTLTELQTAGGESGGAR